MSKLQPLASVMSAMLLAGNWACAQEDDWPFDDNYGDDLAFIHAIANYETHPVWEQAWENQLFSENMLRLNYASISQTELLSDARLVINAELIDGLWFRYATAYYATEFRTRQDDYHSVGLEQRLYKGLSLFIYGNPQFEKEEVDVQYGLSLANADRTHYLRLSYVDVAPFWDDKNDQNSVSASRPWRIDWEANLQLGRFRFFSQGRYDNGTERLFEIEPESTEHLFEARKQDDMRFKFYYYVSAVAFVELAYSYYRYHEDRTFSDPAADYNYDNRIDLYKLGYITPVGDKFRARFGSHAVLQQANADNFGEHDYRHREIIPFLFWEWFVGPGIFEAGYLGAIQRWDYEGTFAIDDPERDGYIDKIQVAYTFDFKGRAQLKIGISQMASLSGFGGGNVQFFMDF